MGFHLTAVLMRKLIQKTLFLACLPASMLQGMTAPGYILSASGTISDNMVLHGVLRQTNVKFWFKRRRRKCECVTTTGITKIASMAGSYRYLPEHS